LLRTGWKLLGDRRRDHRELVLRRVRAHRDGGRPAAGGVPGLPQAAGIEHLASVIHRPDTAVIGDAVRRDILGGATPGVSDKIRVIDRHQGRCGRETPGARYRRHSGLILVVETADGAVLGLLHHSRLRSLHVTQVQRGGRLRLQGKRRCLDLFVFPAGGRGSGRWIIVACAAVAGTVAGRRLHRRRRFDVLKRHSSQANE